MKIVVLDGHAENPGDLSWQGLEALGDVTVYDRTDVHDEALIRARIGDAEAVYTNKTPLTGATIAAAPNLQFIGVLATGYNVVDLEAARQRGIPVCNVPAYGTQEVAQYAMALLLEICGSVGLHDRLVHEGKWAACPDFCFWETPILGLAGKTMGIVGFGRIGRALGRMTAAMGMKVLASGSRPCPEGEAIADYVPLEELLAKSDIISLHCPLTEQTRHLINRDTIAQMKDGQPVWFGCDVGKHSERDSGIMDLDIRGLEDLLDTRFTMTKAERLDYGQSLMTHAMVFQGVNLDENGKPNRWRVENSWGKEPGKDGYYLMTDRWFDEYMYQVVVNKKYLTAEQIAAYEAEPIALEPWDPMGSLAVAR